MANAAAGGSGGGFWAVAALAGSALAAWVLLRLAPVLSHVLFLGFLGILLAAVLDIPIRLLARFMPRWAAFFAALAVLLAVLAGMVWLIVPEVAGQGHGIMRNGRQAVDRLQEWLSGLSRRQGWDRVLASEGTALLDRLRDEVARLAAKAIPVAFGAATIGLEAFATFMIALFISWEPGLYRNGFLRLWPDAYAGRIGSLLDAVGASMRHWAAGTLVSMAAVGVLTGIGLWIIGVEGWLALAAVSFLGEFVPYAGPILSALPALAVGFADSPGTAFWVLVLYVAVQQAEGHLLQPLVMRKAVRIPPALLLLWQIGMALGFGFMGLLLAAPILAALIIVVEQVYVRGALGREPPAGAAPH